MIFTYEKDGHWWIGVDTETETPYDIDRQFLHLESEGRDRFLEICRDLPSAEVYAKTHAAEYGWKEELFEFARAYTSTELPMPIRYFEPYWWCFENSFRYAQKMNLLYVEGIVVTPTGAFVHAWNSHGDDVLDYTYPMQHCTSYYGIEFPVDIIEDHWPIPGGLLGYLYEEAKAETPGFAHRLLYG